MAMVKVLEVWAHKFPAREEVKWTKGDRSGVIPASPEQIGICALVEDVSPTGVRAQIRLPAEYKEVDKVEKGTVFQVEIPDWPDGPLRCREVSREIPPSKQKQP